MSTPKATKQLISLVREIEEVGKNVFTEQLSPEEEEKIRKQRAEILLDPVTKKFKKGNPGYVGRRSSPVSITKAIQKQLRKIVPSANRAKRMRFLDIVVQKILHMAINEGNEHMLRLIWNYIDGLPPGDRGGTILETNQVKIGQINITNIFQQLMEKLSPEARAEVRKAILEFND